MKIQFYPVDISYKTRGEKAEIHIYGKDSKGNPILVIVNDFQPYFWAVLKSELEKKKGFERAEIETSEEEIIPITSKKNSEIYERIKDINIPREDKRRITASKIEIAKKKFLGKEIEALKVFAELPSDVPELRQQVKDFGFETFEADIPFARRFITDRDIIPMTLHEADGEFINQRSRVPVFQAESLQRVSDELMENLRVLAFDIETYNPVGKIAIPESDPIIMCGFYGENFKKVLTWKQFNTAPDYVEFVKDEKALIEKFKEIVEEYKPDVITGYFSDGFDLPYIKKRADFHRVELDIGLDYSPLSIKRGHITTCRVVGIPHIDMFRFIRNIVARSLDTTALTLDSVANELLDERKEDVDIENLAFVWDNLPEKLEEFCKYNLKDAILTYNLLTKTMQNLLELMKIVRLPIYDVSRMSLSQIVEWYLIREAKSFNELIPNKPSYDETVQRRIQTYKGAFVFEPQPGLYKNIVIFDFRSLYPSIITTHNISPDTLNCGCCSEERDEVAELTDWFCKKRKGFISTVIEDLITRRMRIKQIMLSADDKDKKLLKAREQALKTIANSMYGYMGFFASRWYSIECTRSITAYGRHYIKQAIDKVAKAGFKVLYSDTDSVFLALENKTRKDAENFLQNINRELPRLMELEFEGFYPAGIFVSAKIGDFGAKKKYAIMSESGLIRIRGFETVRRNWSIIGKEVQEKVLNIILKEQDAKKAFDYVTDVINKLRKKEIPLEKLVIFTQLQKDMDSYTAVGPHVAVAQRMKALGKLVGAGSMIKYIVTEGKGRIRDRAKLVEETSQSEYDAEYYIKNQIIPSVGKIFEVLGYKEEEILGKSEESKKQQNLNTFFGK